MVVGTAALFCLSLGAGAMNQHWRKKKWRDARRRVEVEDVHVVDYHTTYTHTHTHTHRMCRCVRESAPGGVARRNRLPSRIGSSCRCQAPGCCCCCVVLIPQQQQQRWPDSQSSPSRISTRELVAVPASAPRFQASRHQPSETFFNFNLHLPTYSKDCKVLYGSHHASYSLGICLHFTRIIG